MDSNNTKDETFAFSEDSFCRLEKHQCYDDQSKNDWITGQELLNNEDYWREDVIRRWKYFYRPYNYGKNIGREQKEKLIKLNEKNKEEKEKLTTLKEDLENTENIMIVITVISIIFTLIYLFKSLIVLLLPWLLTLYLLMRMGSYKNDIDYLEDEIYERENDIYVLNRELKYLLDQHKLARDDRLTPNQIWLEFWKELKKLEEELIKTELDKDFNEAIADEELADFYEKTEIEDLELRPKFPVIPSWALLQQNQYESVRGLEVNSLKVVAENVGEGLTTWRKIFENKPLFRVWYIQFFFFQKRNINIVSLYYDFVTGEKYSKHLETYQYNHITNYSYIRADISDRAKNISLEKNDKEINIPEQLKKNVFGNQVDTLSFASASGSSIQSVLSSKDVAVGLEEWLKTRNEMEKFSEENSEEMTNDEREYFYEKTVKADELFSHLARASLKKLRNKVEEFSIARDDEQIVSKRERLKIRKSPKKYENRQPFLQNLRPMA